MRCLVSCDAELQPGVFRNAQADRTLIKGEAIKDAEAICSANEQTSPNAIESENDARTRRQALCIPLFKSSMPHHMVKSAKEVPKAIAPMSQIQLIPLKERGPAAKADADAMAAASVIAIDAAERRRENRGRGFPDRAIAAKAAIMATRVKTK